MEKSIKNVKVVGQGGKYMGRRCFHTSVTREGEKCVDGLSYPAIKSCYGRYALIRRKLVLLRFLRFIFGSRCNRGKYGTRINSLIPVKSEEGADEAEWQAGRMRERARKRGRELLVRTRNFSRLELK